MLEYSIDMKTQAVFIKGSSKKRKHSTDDDDECRISKTKPIYQERNSLYISPIAQSRNLSQDLFSPNASSPKSEFEPPSSTGVFLQTIVDKIRSSAKWLVPVFSSVKENSNARKCPTLLSGKHAYHNLKIDDCVSLYDSGKIEHAKRNLFNKSSNTLSLNTSLRLTESPQCSTELKLLHKYLPEGKDMLSSEKKVALALKKYFKERQKVMFRSKTEGNLCAQTSVSFTDMENYLLLIENDYMISVFLKRDVCRIYADKYLLAMVFSYFIRATLSYEEFNRENFFAALYLAHDMEEEDEDLKYEIFPYSLGKHWRSCYPYLLSIRDDLFWNMNCRSVVSKKCCEQVMSLSPKHWLWKRERPEYHTNISRASTKTYPQGPFGKPLCCKKCLKRECYDSENNYMVYQSATDDSEETISASASDYEDTQEVKKDSGFESFLTDKQDKENVKPLDEEDLLIL